MASLKDFYELILPAGGQYLMGTSMGRRKFVASIGELIEKAKLAEPDERATCFSLASYDNPIWVHAVRSLWAGVIVLDGCENVAYESMEEARAAIDAFAKAAGLPPPVLADFQTPSDSVYGCSGCHAFWPLTEDVRVSRAATMTDRLTELVKRHGLKCEQVFMKIGRIIWMPEDPAGVRLAEPTPPDTMEAILGIKHIF